MPPFCFDLLNRLSHPAVLFNWLLFALLAVSVLFLASIWRLRAPLGVHLLVLSLDLSRSLLGSSRLLTGRSGTGGGAGIAGLVDSARVPAEEPTKLRSRLAKALTSLAAVTRVSSATLRTPGDCQR